MNFQYYELADQEAERLSRLVYFLDQGGMPPPLFLDSALAILHQVADAQLEKRKWDVRYRRRRL